MFRTTAVVLLLLATATVAQEVADKDKQPLLGEWLLVREKTDGGPFATKLKENVARVTIDSESIVAGRAASYRLKASENPKQIDLTLDAGPKAEQGTYLGIYESTGETLKIHLAAPGQPRPTGFEAKPTTISIVLTKSKKG